MVDWTKTDEGDVFHSLDLKMLIMSIRTFWMIRPHDSWQINCSEGLEPRSAQISVIFGSIFAGKFWGSQMTWPIQKKTKRNQISANEQLCEIYFKKVLSASLGIAEEDHWPDISLEQGRVEAVGCTRAVRWTRPLCRTTMQWFWWSSTCCALATLRRGSTLTEWMGIIRTRWKSLLIKEADGYALVTHSIPLYFDHKSCVSLPKTCWILKIWLQNADELRPGYMPPETIKQRKWFPRGTDQWAGRELSN